MRILFFGSSDFSLPALRACLDAPGYELAGVITTPPQKQGRGLELTPTVVADFCKKNKIPVREYSKLDETALEQTKSLRPDIFVVASYGKMIPENFLSLAKVRFNVHPSLLPRYRGASPLNAPILAGDTVTGLSIADVTKALDAGDIYYQEEVPLTATSDSEMMSHVLAEKAYAALLQLLAQAKSGKLSGKPQDPARANYATKLSKENGRLRIQDPAFKWDRTVRGLKPWPGAFTEINSERVSLILVKTGTGNAAASPGTILEITNQNLVIQTSVGCVELISVKPAGKKIMSGADYARGRRFRTGERLS